MSSSLGTWSHASQIVLTLASLLVPACGASVVVSHRLAFRRRVARTQRRRRQRAIGCWA